MLIISKRDRDDVRRGAMVDWGKRRSDAIMRAVVITRAAVITLAVAGTALAWAWGRYGENLKAVNIPNPLSALSQLAFILPVVIVVGLLVTAPWKVMRPGRRAGRAVAFTFAVAGVAGVWLGMR